NETETQDQLEPDRTSSLQHHHEEPGEPSTAAGLGSVGSKRAGSAVAFFRKLAPKLRTRAARARSSSQQNMDSDQHDLEKSFEKAANVAKQRNKKVTVEKTKAEDKNKGRGKGKDKAA
ncbi:hypothetical protein BGX28_002718, partial [Mortierella sp. GBA30]